MRPKRYTKACAKPGSRRSEGPAAEAAMGHVWTYMDPARLQQADWIRCNSHNC
jgi:hypothetical protein